MCFFFRRVARVNTFDEKQKISKILADCLFNVHVVYRNVIQSYESNLVIYYCEGPV